jgi:[FeFe] hydrogenase H-cluster maturation GTPase HydF
MLKAPKGIRLHIGIFGRRNAGKSTLLNSLTRQYTSIVSDTAGTTTDPVEKPMELLPVGPVVFIDTAGIDDVGELGQLRNEKTRKVFDRTDLALIIVDGSSWGSYEKELISEFEEREIPIIVVFNKNDIAEPDPEIINRIKDNNIPFVKTVANEGKGILDVREKIIQNAPDEVINTPSILGDLVRPGALVVLVVPIDMEAPKGRLILPQVQTIRDILDNDAYSMVVKERELRDALARLKAAPALVVTDSQAFLKVDGDTPENIPMTSFSILFARYKGDLMEYVRGAKHIDKLEPGDNILVAEACTHHPIADDIGTVKIPRWLTQYVGGKLNFRHVQGHDYPEDLEDYDLVIQCGSCMLNRREVLTRIINTRRAGIPVTNYGLAIAYTLGIFERALQPFPAVYEFYQSLSEEDLK